MYSHTLLLCERSPKKKKRTYRAPLTQMMWKMAQHLKIIFWEAAILWLGPGIQSPKWYLWSHVPPGKTMTRLHSCFHWWNHVEEAFVTLLPNPLRGRAWPSSIWPMLLEFPEGHATLVCLPREGRPPSPQPPSHPTPCVSSACETPLLHVLWALFKQSHPAASPHRVTSVRDD